MEALVIGLLLPLVGLLHKYPDRQVIKPAYSPLITTMLKPKTMFNPLPRIMRK